MSSTPIVKNTLYAGKRYIPISDGSKAHFHFQTWKLGKERVLLDDSRKIGKKEPMVLVIGQQFKMECWETIVKMMAVGEIASFIVKKELVYSYPFISKTLRELGTDQCKIKHSCTMTLQTEGIGYPDLDVLIANPCDLEFIIELLRVETKDEYTKDLWQMGVQERIDLIPQLREKGNKLYGQKKFDEAEEVYNKAISICEQLMIRERQKDDEWKDLNKLKLPILLNYAQVLLLKGDYYAVIEHCTTVLEFDKDNEKALFRRAKAHMGAWNPELAEADFKRVKSLNPSMASHVDKELDIIKKMRKEKVEADKDKLKNLFINET